MKGERRGEAAEGSFQSFSDSVFALISVEPMRLTIEYCTV